ncbi:hypothetical protein [Streptantibioticus ferralitis]|uniref:Integral membrane protein n=1 Tax=Streptantibioticus ferralitis TaxID=236510 RepID=A0ABT5Z6D2_9ACTN|nr:hypothetical protein [Streptantibioticus ferralitis]MDF2259299.1 hypothetical protein [Streptantibioticus ferralitis]
MPTHPSHHDPDDLAATTTRTRLPEGESTGPAAGRRPVRSSRTLVTVVGVVVLLIAALAFATRGSGGGSGNDGAKGGQAAPTTPTGDRPVAGKTAGIASGFPKTEEGAQSAAANYAVALGGDGMFKAARRHEIVSAVADPSTLDKLQGGYEAAYSAAFLHSIGLNQDGAAPSGETFVNRTIPIGVKLTNFTGDTADASVWCTGIFGLAGEASTKPVTQSWFTVTFKLKWDGSDWKVLATDQTKGPTPISGDNPVSTANEIAGAVQGYGGFTYAR